ncbi:MAG: peptide chain release factor 2 [Clostridiales bacterium]|nr:peptide chain release factor 2 [Clostridiales bacterium]
MSPFDLAGLEEQLAKYRAQMEAPGFWENIENANKVNRAVRPLENKLQTYQKLEGILEDGETLILLAEEAADGSLDEEIVQSVEQAEREVEQFHLATLLSGQYDANSAILSLHAGAGGTEAQDWTSMLYRMYTRWAERHGYAVKVLDYLDGEEAGIKSVTFLVDGLNAYGYLKGEKGVHRLVRISPFESSARRHTSFASLDVIPQIEADEGDVEINPDEIKIDTYRSSGAGGQHVNKTDSAVRITHLPTGIVVQCQNERSQVQNKEACMNMLRAKLVEQRERKLEEEMQSIKGEMKKIEWGSQIRSYVFQPYTLVKDHRTSAESGNIGAVMDGEIDLFINAYLVMS